MTSLLFLFGCGSDGDGGVPAKPYAVLSAFPAELAAVLEHTQVDETVVVGGHRFRIGRLGGARVVVGMTGIGLLNAAATTAVALDHFDVAGVIVSAVAGGNTLPIGDVAVPEAWQTRDGLRYAAHAPWLALAQRIAVSGAVELQRCTRVPAVTDQPVCMPAQPGIYVGGAGQSSDPYGKTPFLCQPNGGDLYGCDVTSTAAASFSTGLQPMLVANAEPAVVVDMETAAIAKEALSRGLPFIAFRAVSDGPGDPLHLPSFLEQFPAYYPLAAHNAAAAATIFLEHLTNGA